MCFQRYRSLACGVTVPVAQIFEMRVNDREVVTAVTDDVETENVSCLCERCICRLREQSRSDVNCGSRSALRSRRRVVLSLRRRPRKARGKFSLESVTFGFLVSFVIQFLLVRGVQIH